MSINITIAWEEQDRACMDRLSSSLDRFADALNRYTGAVSAPCQTEADPEEECGAVAPLNPDVIMPSYDSEPEAEPVVEHTTDADEIPCGPGPEEETEPVAEVPEAPEAPEDPPAKPIDLADFQAAVARYLAGGGDRAALKAHLEATYGVGQVRAVPEDKRAEVLKHIGA